MDKRSAQICKHGTNLGNLRTITQEEKMTPLFSSTFLAVCDTHFVFENFENSFS